MKKIFIILALVVVVLMGRECNMEIKEYKTEIAQLETENAELQDTVYELDSEIQLLLEDTYWADLPVYDDTVEGYDVDWTTWDNLKD